MKAIRFPVLGVTLLVLIYCLTPWLPVPSGVVALLFLLSSAMTIWMVIRILKDGSAPNTTFEDQWYEDRPQG